MSDKLIKPKPSPIEEEICIKVKQEIKNGNTYYSLGVHDYYNIWEGGPVYYIFFELVSKNGSKDDIWINVIYNYVDKNDSINLHNGHSNFYGKRSDESIKEPLEPTILIENAFPIEGSWEKGKENNRFWEFISYSLSYDNLIKICKLDKLEITLIGEDKEIKISANTFIYYCQYFLQQVYNNTAYPNALERYKEEQILRNTSSYRIPNIVNDNKEILSFCELDVTVKPAFEYENGDVNSIKISILPQRDVIHLFITHSISDSSYNSLKISLGKGAVYFQGQDNKHIAAATISSGAEINYHENSWVNVFYCISKDEFKKLCDSNSLDLVFMDLKKAMVIEIDQFIYYCQYVYQQIFDKSAYPNALKKYNKIAEDYQECKLLEEKALKAIGNPEEVNDVHETIINTIKNIDFSDIDVRNRFLDNPFRINIINLYYQFCEKTSERSRANKLLEELEESVKTKSHTKDESAKSESAKDESAKKETKKEGLTLTESIITVIVIVSFGLWLDNWISYILYVIAILCFIGSLGSKKEQDKN